MVCDGDVHGKGGALAEGGTQLNARVVGFEEKPAEFDPRKYLGPAREELKNMINDDKYLQIAIQRIATKLTNEIVNRNGEKNGFK